MTHHQQNTRRGITTIELALVIPFIFVFAMCMIEMGNMGYSWMTVQKAAQSGARFAATGQGEEEGNRLALIIQSTEEWLGSLSDGDKIVTVRSWATPSATGEGADGNPGGPCQLVEVEVVFDYHPVTPIISSMFPDSIKLVGHDRKLNEPWKPCDS